MPLSRRHFNQMMLGAMAATLLPSAAFAELEEGQDWRAINPPQPSDTPGKIEVLEFFSYGCPHCKSLNPLILQWESTLPEDVAFRQVPVTFGRQSWENLARLFYSLEIMGALGRLDQAVFEALHEEHIKLYTKSAMIDWLKTKDVDATRFSDVFDSFDVQTKLGRAEYLARRYAIDAVPTIAVGGRYVVLGRRIKTQPELLTIADQLIEKARADSANG